MKDGSNTHRTACSAGVGRIGVSSVFHPWLIGLALSAGLLLAAEPGQTPSAVSPLFSPDGTNVVFALVTGAGTDIAVVPSAGGKPRVLASFLVRAEPTQWSPDGKSLLVAAGNSWRVTLEPGCPQPVGGEGARISPDGKTLAFIAEGRLELLDEGDGLVLRPGAVLGAGCRMGDWLDNDTLVVLTGDGSIATIRRAAPEAHRILVPHKSMAHCFVAAAANTKRRLIAATSDDMQLADPNNPTSIWIFDSTGKQVGKPIPNATKPQWTATGQLFFARRSQVMMTADFETTRSFGKAETWAVSPNGSLLVVSRREANATSDGLPNLLGVSKLYRIPIEAGTAGRAQPLINEP